MATPDSSLRTPLARAAVSHAALAHRAVPGIAVRVGTFGLSELVAAGLAVMVAPHADRVVLVRESAEVVLFDPDNVPRGLPEAYRLGGTRAVAFGSEHSRGGVARSRALGARGFIPLDVTGTDLVEALESVARKGGLSPYVAGRGPVGPPGTPHPARLSDREAAIIVAICGGLSNSEIADELFLSINSVKTYIRTAYRKMGVRSRSQAVVWGLQHGF